MSGSPAFVQMCDALQRASGLSPIEARGTVRLLLKEVGLDPTVLGKQAARVAVDRLLENELRKRGVRHPAVVKAQVLRALERDDLEAAEEESPEAIFGRITFRR